MTTNSNNIHRPEWDLLLSAAQKNNAAEIQHLITNLNVNPGHGNALGQTALHVACLWGHVEAVQTLLSLSAPPTSQNRITNGTPLHCAVQSRKPTVKRRVDCIYLLCKYILKLEENEKGGGGVNIVDKYNCTPLDYIEEILEEGKVLGVVEDEEEWLRAQQIIRESGGGDGEEEEEEESEEFKVLLGCVDAYNVEGVLACLERAHEIKEEEADALLKKRQKSSGRTPLLVAFDKFLSLYDNDDNDETLKNENIINNNAETMVQIIQYLLEYNSNPYATPQQRPIKNHRRDKNKKVTMRQRQHNQQIHLQEINEEDEEENNSDDEMQDSEVDMLHRVCTTLYSCYSSSTSSSSYSSLKDDGNHEEHNNKSIQYLEQVAILLYQHRLTYNKMKKPSTILHMDTQQLLHESCRRNKLHMVQFLLEKLQMNPNITKQQQFTPLHFASRSGNVEIVRYLLSFHQEEEVEEERGTDDDDGDGGGDGEKMVVVKVDINAKDNGGRNALDMARINGRDDVAVLLEEAMELKML